MRKALLVAAFILLAVLDARAQQPLPNVSYNAYLNSACSNSNSSCSGAVFVTGSQGANVNGSLGSGPALDIPVTNYSAATITVSGTYAGATINFDFSDPTGGTNYFQEVCARTDINLLETNEVLPSNQIRAWQCPVWAAVRFRVRLSAYTSGSVNVWVTLTTAAIDPSLVVAASIANVSGASDPCQDVSAQKSSVAINQAASTQLITNSGTTSIYVCGYNFTAATGTSATYEFEYGTGTTCGTGTTALTGAYTGNSSAPVSYGPGSTLFKVPSTDNLCLINGGTSPSAQGVLTFVQQ